MELEAAIDSNCRKLFKLHFTSFSLRLRGFA
jgi:hypothetical protein